MVYALYGMSCIGVVLAGTAYLSIYLEEGTGTMYILNANHMANGASPI